MKTAIILIAFFAFMFNASAQIKINSDRQLCTTDGYPFAFKVGATMAGFSGNSSNSNVSFGYASLNNPLTGLDNVAVGYHALFSNTTGNANTAIGSHALYTNTSGEYNTATGSAALSANTEGNGNVATGSSALSRNTTGSYNTANGYSALYFNTTGNSNTATGSYALYTNTSGEFNTAAGHWALYTNTSGEYNTATGSAALSANTKGNGNVATGSSALSHNTTGSYNTANGYATLYANTTGACNTTIGSFSDVNSNNLNNTIAIGYYARVNASNQIRLGNYTATSAGGAVSWSTVSDGRAKTNIRAEVPGLNFINRLQPVTYNLDLKAIDELLKSDDPKINAHRDSLQKAMSPEERRITEEARANKESKVYSGFIAQDVEKAAKETGYDFSGVDAPENGKGPYGLRYAEFVVPLVKAVQELSEQNSRLQAQINELTGKKPAPERVIASAEVSTATGSGASLEQNIPNPFNQNTEIRFYLPASVTNAALCIYDLQGKQLKQITLSGRGEGSQNISGSEFSAGIYLYALIADGQEVDVKRMILTE